MYLLLCRNHSLYCGISNDAPRRFAAHCAGKGAKYTRMHPPVEMRIVATLPDKAAAARMEAAVKAMSSTAKRALWQRLPPAAAAE